MIQLLLLLCGIWERDIFPMSRNHNTTFFSHQTILLPLKNHFKCNVVSAAGATGYEVVNRARMDAFYL